jgi:hypothetical protein
MAFRLKVAALAAFVVMTLVAAAGYHSAWAQDADVHPSASTQERPKPAAHASNARASVPNARGEPAGYYVEFRAIDGFIYGHTVIAYGRLNARGQPIEEHYAGFEPDGGSIGAAFGHVMPVSGSIKTSRESVNFAIVDSYRRRLTPQQYRSLLGAVAAAKKHTYVWNAVLHNCNDFMADMAHAVGLKAPPNVVIPYAYIGVMRSLNGG